MIEVRVFGLYGCPKGQLLPIDTFMSPCVPHKGDKFCVMYYKCPVVSVEWMTISHEPTVDVIIDNSEVLE